MGFCADTDNCKVAKASKHMVMVGRMILFYLNLLQIFDSGNNKNQL
jgi:hypothetical protein